MPEKHEAKLKDGKKPERKVVLDVTFDDVPDTRRLSFWVEGVPVPMPRPRVSFRGGKAHVYPNARAEAWKKMVYAEYLKIAIAMKFKAMEKGEAVNVGLQFFLRNVATARPDLDNLAKTVLDALNGAAWHDDSQIVCLLIEKKKSATPGVLVGIFRAR